MSNLLVAVLLSISGPEPASAAPTPAATRLEEITALRQNVRQALTETARTKDVDFDRDIPRLLTLYKEIEDSRLASTEKTRMRTSVGLRLVSWHSIVRARLNRAGIPRQVLQQGGINPGAAAGGQGAGGAGGAGGVPNRAWELIDLIETTIAPSTWEVNGGRGSISFYPPLNALIIRQSHAVHDDVGAALQNLRP